MNANRGLPLLSPKIIPPLHADFCPAVFANRAFRASVQPRSVAVQVALERADGAVSRFQTIVAARGTLEAEANFFYLERLLKFLLWSRGGCKLHFAGPRELGEQLLRHYQESATGRFDASVMGGKIYEKAFVVALTNPEEFSLEKEATAALGRA